MPKLKSRKRTATHTISVSATFFKDVAEVAVRYGVPTASLIRVALGRAMDREKIPLLPPKLDA
jgi:hypothetical protein